MDEDGWTTHAHWWNGRYGWSKIDLKHRSRGPRHAVLERTGGANGNVTKLYDGTDEEGALGSLNARLAVGTGWIDLLDAIKATNARLAARSAQRLAEP